MDGVPVVDMVDPNLQSHSVTECADAAHVVIEGIPLCGRHPVAVRHAIGERFPI